jgi:hypothetical protein
MPARQKILIGVFSFLFFTNSQAVEHIVSLSQKIEFKTGDVIKLKDSYFTVTVNANKGTECAVPGFNCGSGYIPPHPELKINCQGSPPCPYVILDDSKTATSGTLSIENEKSCETNQPEICFSAFSRNSSSDDICQKLLSPIGRYYCLRRFENSARPENKGLCDQLPESIYALKWNCFYEYAVRYKDVTFCDKYSAQEADGRDRCLLKMAEINQDVSLCSKISNSQQNTYREQCENLKKTIKAP